jgi:hypothetical protein
MSSLLRRGGPLAGPRLLIAFFAVVIVFFYLSQPYSPSSQDTGIPTPQSGSKPSGNRVPPSASPGEVVPAPPTEEKDEKESLSDKFVEYLKGHSSHGHKSNSPIPHLEHSNGQAPVLTPNATSTDPFCSHLPSTNDLLIVVRTPASDLYTHLPAHFFTTLRCAPFLLYSTVSQNIGPYTVYDSLANISDSRRAKHRDFELYDKLQAAQNAVQEMGALKEDNDHNLDKWSIIPHVLSAYKMHPEKKWFVFIESDTYLSLPNMLRWLGHLDPDKPIFAGAQVMIGDVELAHSGSGIVLSQAAVRDLATLSKTRTDAWEDMVGNSCCGDKILAEALKEANVTLHRSFPMIQGETPFSLDWSPKHWCRSAMTWHRMTPSTLDMLWQFEQDWVKKHSSNDVSANLETIPPMLFRDYFQKFLVPLVRASQNRSDWDNLSDSQTLTDASRAQYAHFSFDACRAACDLRDSCVQYAWQPNKCRLGNVVRLGESVHSDMRMKSGWLPQKVEKFGELVGECKESDAWILPESPEQKAESDRKAKEMREEERKEQELKKEEERKKEELKKNEENKKTKKEEEKKEPKKDEENKEPKKDEENKEQKKDEENTEQKKEGEGK